MLLLIVIVHLSYFRREPLRVNLCCVTNFLCFVTLETEFILAYFYLFIPHKALSWSISEASKLILSLWAFVLLLLLLLSIMPIDSRTWYARIGVFQSTKIVTQSKSFQKDNLDFTAQNIALLYNKMSIKFSWSYFSWCGYCLKFDEYILTQCKKAGRKIKALARVCTYLSLERRRTLMKAFIESQFAYCPLIWMFCQRSSNTRINHLHKELLESFVTIMN